MKRQFFDQQAFQAVIEAQGLAQTPGAKADTIAHATKKAIAERLEQDPAFYEKFSKLIQQAIDDFRNKRISDLTYLQQALEIRDAVLHRKAEAAPESIQGNADAIALFGIFKTKWADRALSDDVLAQLAADIHAQDVDFAAGGQA